MTDLVIIVGLTLAACLLVGAGGSASCTCSGAARCATS